MKTALIGRALAFLALGAALAGCGKSPNAPGATGSTDQTVALATLAADPNIVSDDVYATSTSTQAFGARPSGPVGPAAAINPRFFWRNITGESHTFSFAFGDTDAAGHPRQADVTITREFTGTFNILKAMQGDSTAFDSAHLVQKNLDDTWVRHVHLLRVHPSDSTHFEWRVVGVSGVVVTSSGATTNIQSLHVQSGLIDTTITDPLQTFSLPRAFSFAAGDSVTLTATTSHADDIVLMYWHDMRQRFHNNGDGTYTITLHIGHFDGGYRWMGVNALSNGTLFDDVAPYDSKAWLGFCFIGARPSGDHF